jgi:hypothetical protein
MESTEAHLKQLTAEVEELYATLLDQDAVRGFIDLMGGALKGVNNYVRALGGGFNSLLGVASQVANIFNGQIASRISGIIDNRNIRKQQKENEEAKDDILGAEPDPRDKVSSAMFKAELEYAKKIKDVRKYLNQEQLKELTEHQKEIGLLEREKLLNEKNLEIKNKEAAVQEQQNKSDLDKIKADYDASHKEQLNLENSVDVRTALAEHQQKLLEAYNEEDEARKKQAIEDETRYIEVLKQRLEILTEIDELENNKSQINEKQKKHKDAVDTGTKKTQDDAKIQKTVRYTTAALQATTSLIGAFKTFANETSTAEERANSLFQAGVGGLAAIANAALPGSGIIVQMAGGLLDSIGLTDLLAKGLESDAERAARVAKETADAFAQQEERVKEIENSYKNLQSSFDSYLENVDALDNLTQGTEE